MKPTEKAEPPPIAPGLFPWLTSPRIAWLLGEPLLWLMGRSARVEAGRQKAMTAEHRGALPSRRPGLCDFVPQAGRAEEFVAHYHPEVHKVSLQMGEFGLESLLEKSRLLALMELAKHCVESALGELIELGVYKGGSAAAVAFALTRAGLQRPFHLCDTFAGLPESGAGECHQARDFGDTDCEVVLGRLRAFLPQFPFHAHRGLFSETLPALSSKSFCFAHVDADLYESVHAACAFLYPRIARGGIIVFDDYGAPTCPGATLAVDQFFADKPEKPSHIARCAYGVRIGSVHSDFRDLLLRRTFVPAGLAALQRGPREGAALIARPGAVRSVLARGALALGRATYRQFDRRALTANPDLARVSSILVARPDEIGDTVLTGPFLRELRHNAPDAWITLIVKPATRNLVELCPHVNEVLTYEWYASGQLAGLRRHAQALALARRHLWRRRFDVALVPRRDVDYCHASFLAYFSGAPFRVGYSENVTDQKSKLNAGFDRLFSHLIYDRAAKHEVQYSLDVIRFLGGHVQNDSLELWLGGEDEAFAEDVLSSSSVGPDDLLIAFGPGAGAAKRVWPIANFLKLGAWLVREYGARIMVVGANRDGDLGDQLERLLGDRAINLVGRTTLRQAGALLKLCQIYVGNDAGPMHLAAAAGIPVVEISCHPQNGSALHANSPRRFGPWGVPRIILQPEAPREPCSEACGAAEAHCILEVGVERAKEAVRALAGQQFASAPFKRGVLGAS